MSHISKSIDNLANSLEAVILGSPQSADRNTTAITENRRQQREQNSNNSNNTNPSSSYSNYSIDEDLLNAAKETSSCLTNNENLPDSLSRFEFFRSCQEKSLINKLKASLEEDPTLANIRQTKGEIYHGQTPLHTAAMHANIEAIKVLLNSKRVSAWARDLYGRTPLHLVSIHLHLQGSIAKMPIDTVLACCRLLRDAMIRERGIDPVGVNAPTDLAGMYSYCKMKFKYFDYVACIMHLLLLCCCYILLLLSQLLLLLLSLLLISLLFIYTYCAYYYYLRNVAHGLG